MSTETINIVVAQSGATEAKTAIADIGTAATVTDTQLSDMLVRSGAVSTQLQAVAKSTSVASQSLQAMNASAGTATSALNATGAEATSLTGRLLALLQSAKASALGLLDEVVAAAAADKAMRDSAAQATTLGSRLLAMYQSAKTAAAGLFAIGGAGETAVVGMGAAKAEASVLGEKISGLQATFAALGLALGIKEFVKLTDTWTDMRNKLLLLDTATDQVEKRQQALFDIAQSSHQPLDGITQVYFNMAQALRGIHVSGDDVVTFTKVLAQGAELGGHSVNDITTALNRLGVELRQGSVSGRSFVQFLQEFPELGEKIGVALGFAAGPQGFAAFVKAAQAGEISAESFIKQANTLSTSLQKESEKTAVTVSQAFINIENSFLRYIGTAGQAADTTSKLATVLLFLADHINIVVGVVATIAAGWGAYAAAGSVAALVTSAISLSFAGIIGVATAVAVALAFLSTKFPIIGEVATVAFQYAKAAVSTFIEVLSQLGTYLTGSTQGLTVLGAALGTLGIIVLRVVAVPLATMILGWAAAFIAAIPTILAVSAALVGLAAEYAAVRFATVALTQGFEAAKQDLKGWTDGIIQAGQTIKDKFAVNLDKARQSVQDMSKELEKTKTTVDDATPTVIRFGQGASQAMQKIGDGATSAGVSVTRFGSNFSSVGNSVSSGSVGVVNSLNGITSATNAMGDSALTAGDNFAKAGKQETDALGRVSDVASSTGQRVADAWDVTVNAMGQLIKVTSEWEIQSGAAFNKVAGEAASFTSSLQGDAASLLNTTKTVSSSSSGGGGFSGSGGNSGSGFSFSESFGPSLADVASQLKAAGGDYNEIYAATVSADRLFGTPQGPNTQAALAAVIAKQNDKVKSILHQVFDAYPGRYPTFQYGGDFTVSGSGGTDSQLVQFLATPGEKVTVNTPDQVRRYGNGDSQGQSKSPILINMTVNTPDANSFRRSQTQVTQELLGKIQRTQQLLSTK